jgi:hypothetical protein
VIEYQKILRFIAGESKAGFERKEEVRQKNLEFMRDNNMIKEVSVLSILKKKRESKLSLNTESQSSLNESNIVLNLSEQPKGYLHIDEDKILTKREQQDLLHRAINSIDREINDDT